VKDSRGNLSFRNVFRRRHGIAGYVLHGARTLTGDPSAEQLGGPGSFRRRTPRWTHDPRAADGRRRDRSSTRL